MPDSDTVKLTQFQQDVLDVLRDPETYPHITTGRYFRPYIEGVAALKLCGCPITTALSKRSGSELESIQGIFNRGLSVSKAIEMYGLYPEEDTGEIVFQILETTDGMATTNDGWLTPSEREEIADTLETTWVMNG